MLFHSLSVRRQSKIIRMECLHGKPALATTTKNGLFWYCGNKPSCQFFCPQKDLNIFARAVANRDRLFYCCPNNKKNSCGFFEWKTKEDSNEKCPRGSNINDHPCVERLCCLFSYPPHYKYRVSDTGLTFQSRREDPNEAFAEYIGELPNLSITDLTEGWTPELKENN